MAAGIDIERRKMLPAKLAGDESFEIYKEKGLPVWQEFANKIITAE